MGKERLKYEDLGYHMGVQVVAGGVQLFTIYDTHDKDVIVYSHIFRDTKREGAKFASHEEARLHCELWFNEWYEGLGK